MSDKNNGKKWALGAMIAAAAGYVTGVLTAPKSGKDTREDMKDAMASGALEGERRLEELQAQLDSGIVEARKIASDLTGKAKDEIGSAVGVADKAKNKAKEMLSALRDGKTDDENLKKAVAEADKALKDLKKFLKK